MGSPFAAVGIQRQFLLGSAIWEAPNWIVTTCRRHLVLPNAMGSPKTSFPRRRAQVGRAESHRARPTIAHDSPVISPARYFPCLMLICDGRHRPLVGTVVVWCPKRGSMFSAILLAVAALYAVFGAVIVRGCANQPAASASTGKSAKPRVGALAANRQPCWSCGQTIACAEPTHIRRRLNPRTICFRLFGHGRQIYGYRFPARP